MGRIKAAVLSAANGVITEERFQKMTQLQWMFHYVSLAEERKAKNEDIESILKIATGYGDMLITAANPDMGKELSRLRELAKNRADVNEENMEEVMAAIEASTPLEMVVEHPEDNKKTPLILPVTTKEKMRGQKPRFLVNGE